MQMKRKLINEKICLKKLGYTTERQGTKNMKEIIKR